jgi:hypothetical protein
MLPQMVAGKGGYSWKAARARIPPYRQITHTARSPRVLVPLAIVTAIVLLWRSMGSAASEVQRYGQALGSPHVRKTWSRSMGAVTVING